jgi:hypothetical protein
MASPVVCFLTYVDWRDLPSEKANAWGTAAIDEFFFAKDEVTLERFLDREDERQVFVLNFDLARRPLSLELGLGDDIPRHVRPPDRLRQTH